MRLCWLALPVLAFVPLVPAKAQVPGSYRQSCRNVYQSGSFLSADCRGNGGLTHSTLDLNRCRGQGVFNAYGRLACGNVVGSADEGRPRGGYDGGGYRPPPPPGYRPPPPPPGYGYQPDDDDDGDAPPPPRPRYPPPGY